jgi:hypothetical protein
MSYEESVSYFKGLENLEKIRQTNSPNPSSLPVDNKKRVSVTSSVCKYSKNHEGSNMWCHYCDKSNHNTRLIAEQSPNLNSRKRLALKPKLDTDRSLWPSFFLSEEINAIKRQLKPEMSSISRKRNKKD